MLKIKKGEKKVVWMPMVWEKRYDHRLDPPFFRPSFPRDLAAREPSRVHRAGEEKGRSPLRAQRVPHRGAKQRGKAFILDRMCCFPFFQRLLLTNHIFIIPSPLIHTYNIMLREFDAEYRLWTEMGRRSVTITLPRVLRSRDRLPVHRLCEARWGGWHVPAWRVSLSASLSVLWAVPAESAPSIDSCASF